MSFMDPFVNEYCFVPMLNKVPVKRPFHCHHPGLYILHVAHAHSSTVVRPLQSVSVRWLFEWEANLQQIPFHPVNKFRIAAHKWGHRTERMWMCIWMCLFSLWGVFTPVWPYFSPVFPQRDPGFNQIWPNRLKLPKVENVRLCKVRLHAGAGEFSFDVFAFCESESRFFPPNVTVESWWASGWTWLPPTTGESSCG